jgi:hypothetical protein
VVISSIWIELCVCKFNVYFISLYIFQLPFGDDDDGTLPTFSQDNEIASQDLAQSFVNLELGQVKIETTQQVMLYLCTFLKLVVTY